LQVGRCHGKLSLQAVTANWDSKLGRQALQERWVSQVGWDTAGTMGSRRIIMDLHQRRRRKGGTAGLARGVWAIVAALAACSFAPSVATAGVAGAPEPAGAGYSWFPPLAPPLLLTGTFGEPRSGHLHGGIDLSTGGEIGRPVRAVADGSVVRVRAKASGYGRAIYLDTDMGLQVVYGHLDHFAPALEAYVRREQEAQGEFEIELYPEPGTFRFSRGDILAYSGETGAGPPHLHFEFRQGDEQINPLTLGIQAYDNVAPSLGPMRMRALAARAWVEGGVEAERSLPTTEPIAVWGPVGVEIGVFDRTGQNTSRLAPLHLELFLDGEPIFARTFARVDLARGNDVRRIYGRSCRGSDRWILRLYHWPAGAPADVAEDGTNPTGAAEDAAGAVPGAGLVDAARLAPGPHVLRVEAQDAAGRGDAASWRIEAVRPIVPAEWRCEHDGHGGWLAGLRLTEAPQPERLPLRLVWRRPSAGGKNAGGRGKAASAGGKDAGGRGEGQWLALGEGWFAAHIPEDGPLELEILDAAGQRLVAPLIAGAAGSLDGATVQVQPTEGGFLFELRCAGPLPGLPSLDLVDDQGGVLGLIARGPSPGGAWTYLLECSDPTPLRGPVRAVRLRAGGEQQRLELAPSGLLVLTGPDSTGATPAEQVGPLTLRPRVDTFRGPLCLAQEVWAPGDARWEAVAESGSRGGESGLRLLSPIVAIGPEWWPLEAPLDIAFDPAALTDPQVLPAGRCGLYRLAGDDSWHWLDQVGASGPLGTAVSALGRWALLEDAAPPRVLWSDPRPGAELSSRPARLRVGVSDLGSGFDPREADILLDGRMLLAEWDVDAGALSAPVDPGLPAGAHRWEARIVDRAGNACSRAFEFRVGAGHPPARGR
jgi:hypothetical protein